MGRALLVLETPADRQKAVSWIGKAPVGTRVEFKASKRTLPQNDLLWALLTEVSQQVTHVGNRYDPAEWKALFLHAFGREVRFLPGLDGKTFLPIEQSSSDLSKQEMTDLIEFILAWGAQNGVTFRERESGTDPQPDTADATPPASAEGSTEPTVDPSHNTDASPAGASGTAGDPDPSSGSPANDPERDILIRYARDVLPMAADTSVSLVALKEVEKQWAADELSKLSDAGKAKARAISESMRAVANDPARLEGVLEHYAGLLECTVEELKDTAP